MRLAISIFAIAACFFITAACSSQTKEFTDKKLIIANKETVKIKELDLSITNNGCGRKWIVEDGKPAYERAYCDLLIEHKDSIIYTGGDFQPVQIGNIEITLDKMNPWGREEDSVPPGGCRVWLRKIKTAN